MAKTVSATVSIDHLADAVADLITEYAGSCAEEVKECVDAAAKLCVKRVKELSPRDRPEYYKGWTQKIDTNTSMSKTRVIYNSKFPGLVHLLEDGHANRDGGRFAGVPHVSTAETEATEKLGQLIEEALKR